MPVSRSMRPTSSVGNQPSALHLCWILALVGSACTREPPPGAEGRTTDRTSTVARGPSQPGAPTLPEELTPGSSGDAGTTADAAAEPPPYDGPYFAVTAIAAAIYSVPAFDKKKKTGYVRNGGRVPVTPEPVSRKRCRKGWRELVSGGFLCGNLGTTDLEHPQVKFAIRPPDLDSVLPYQYARNVKNGTPLYKSVPSRDQMNRYEPYLESAKKAKKKTHAESKGPSARSARTSAPARETSGRDGGAKVLAAAVSADGGAASRTPPSARLLADAGIALRTEADAGAPEIPWWQRENAKERLHELRLEQLHEDADDVLAKRMVEGFYVAIDKPFNWNGRRWYKTTKGLVAPADRMWIAGGSKFEGVEIDGEKWRLPVAWVYGGRKSAPTYEIDPETRKVRRAARAKRFEPLQLTGESATVKGITYEKTSDGTWVKHIHVRITSPGPPPADLEATEKWIDVNLKEQTLVAFVGTRPVYATLVSTGKSSRKKDKDHRTPTGEWRIREKHITTTMDGDGTVAGDLPYSIEDVPYVMYYHRSFALHGAFWHRNFGVQMSHGCVNLAPLDAKHLFFFTDPPMPEGWHGTWATPDRPGSRIVVHE